MSSDLGSETGDNIIYYYPQKEGTGEEQDDREIILFVVKYKYF